MLAKNNAGRGAARCAASVSPGKPAWSHILIGGPGFAAPGRHSQKSSAGPAIEFTMVPPAARGGRERTDTIAARARNPHRGQQIYAPGGTLWVPPWPDRAFASVPADSTRSTETPLGFEYVAPPVDPEYHPLLSLDVAPAQGGLAAPVQIVKGTGTPQFAPTGFLTFSGYDRAPLLESWQMEGWGL